MYILYQFKWQVRNIITYAVQPRANCEVRTDNDHLVGPVTVTLRVAVGAGDDVAPVARLVRRRRHVVDRQPVHVGVDAAGRAADQVGLRRRPVGSAADVREDEDAFAVVVGASPPVDRVEEEPRRLDGAGELGAAAVPAERRRVDGHARQDAHVVLHVTCAADRRRHARVRGGGAERRDDVIAPPSSLSSLVKK